MKEVEIQIHHHTESRTEKENTQDEQDAEGDQLVGVAKEAIEEVEELDNETDQVLRHIAHVLYEAIGPPDDVPEI